jgi:hypothetical protein
MLQNLNRGTERERLVFAMRETRWNETKVFAQITSVSNILLGFFYLGGTKVQKGGSLFPNPFRDSLIHPAMRLDSRKALAERIVPRPFHSSHLISSLCTNTFWDAAALWQQMAAPCRNGAAEGMLIAHMLYYRLCPPTTKPFERGLRFLEVGMVFRVVGL